MRNFVAVVVTLLFTAASLFGGDFVAPSQKILKPEGEISLGSLVELDLSRPTTVPDHWVAASYDWHVFEVNKDGLVEQNLRRGRIGDGVYFAAGMKPRTLYVECYITHLYGIKTNGRLTEFGTRSVLLRDTLMVGGSTPLPPIPPGPTPPPTPEPPITPSKLFVLIIEETGDAVVEKAMLMRDQAIMARMKSKGHQWRIVDKDVRSSNGVTPPDLVRFFEATKGKTLPQLFLVDDHGLIRWSGDMPRTPAAFLEAMQKVGG